MSILWLPFFKKMSECCYVGGNEQRQIMYHFFSLKEVLSHYITHASNS